jgi:hypothetical protein
MPPDWLTAFDDFLCGRWRTCVFCGAAATQHVLYSAASAADFAMTVGLCQRCDGADPDGRRVQALVEQHARRQQP